MISPFPLKTKTTILRAHSTAIPNPPRTLWNISAITCITTSPQAAINSNGTSEGPAAFQFSFNARTILLLPNRCRPLRGWKTRPEKERRGRPNRHHSIPAPRERGLIQPFFRWAGPWTPSCGWRGFWPYRGMSRWIPDRQPRLGLATCVRQK